MNENLKITFERFEYFIQKILKPYTEPPLLLIMFKENRNVKIVEPTSIDLNDFKLYSMLIVRSFKSD